MNSVSILTESRLLADPLRVALISHGWKTMRKGELSEEIKSIYSHYYDKRQSADYIVFATVEFETTV